MRLKIILLALITAPLFLASCGGDSNNPYDGTWALVYPALQKQSSVTPTESIICIDPPATIVIRNATGTGTVNASCTTTINATSGVAATSTTLNTYAIIGVSITARTDITSKDIFNAIANGVTFTGQCLSNNACSGLDTAGDTISINR